MNNLIKLVVAVGVSGLAGALGSLFTAPAIPTWYAGLVKPELAPPNWLFAPVWTTLYLLMGIALFLVWRQGLDRSDVRKATWIFGIQIILNSLWSFIFFGMQNPGLAFLEIILLWLAIAMTIFWFGRVSKVAAWLLVPYLVWVSFASYLNLMIWRLN